MIFLGPPGIGKSHVAVVLALKACQAGLSIYFTTMPDLIIKLRKDHEAGRPGKGRSDYKSSLVIVDEVGYTPINRAERTLRFAVIERQGSPGTQIKKGNRLVERILSLQETCHLKAKATFPVLVDCINAYFQRTLPNLSWF